MLFILRYILLTLATLRIFLFWFLVSVVRLVRMWVLSPPPSFPCVSVLFLACYLAAMPLLWLTHDSGLSPSGLICCYAMSSVKLTQSPLVIHPPFAWQQGSLTYILSWAFQLALVGLWCPRVPQSWLVGWLLCPDVVCSMSQDSGLSFPGLICCYAMSLWWLTYSPWLYALRCLATGIVNLLSVMGLSACPSRTAVPQGSSVLRGSGSSRWGHLSQVGAVFFLSPRS